MIPEQIEAIPDDVLIQPDTHHLREWLQARGWRMTLAELSAERERRNLTPRRFPRQADRKKTR